MPIGDLDSIRTKIRRLTRALSEAQLTTAQIDDYINQFLMLDFPGNIKLEEQKQDFVFYTNPGIRKYSKNITDPLDPLYYFDEIRTNFQPPVYVAGSSVYYCQSPDEFNRLYPNNDFIISIGKGNGVAINFTGTLSQHPLISELTSFSTVDLLGVPLEMHFQSAGVLNNENLSGNSGANTGTLNYNTGAYDITFFAAPGNGQDIWVQGHQEPLAKPTGLLYWQNSFYLRPVPDQVYEVRIECNRIPNPLLAFDQYPEFRRWWEYIAYGAARKVLQDRMDLESLNLIDPEFRKQESLVLRHTIMQSANERASTIYTGINAFGTYEKFGGL